MPSLAPFAHSMMPQFPTTRSKPAAHFLILGFAVLLQCQEAPAQLRLISPNGTDASANWGAPQDHVEQGDEVQARRAEIEHELRLAQRVLDAAKGTSDENTGPPEKLQREVELLKQLDVIVAQRETALAEKSDRESKLGELQEQLQTVMLAGPQESKPYSFLLLDRLRDDLATRKSRTEIGEAVLADAKQAVLRAKETLESKQKTLRRLMSESGKGAEDAPLGPLSAEVTIAEAEERVAGETKTLKEQQRDIAELTQQIQTTRIELLAEKVEWIAKEVVFSEPDLQDVLTTLDKRESDLKNSLRSAESNLSYTEREWERSRHRLDEMVNEPDAALAERVKAQQLARQGNQQMVSLLNSRLERVGKDRELWNRRFQVATAAALPDELINWADETHSLIAQLDREVRLQFMRVDEIRRTVASLEQELQAKSSKRSEAKKWMKSQRNQLSQMIQIHETAIASVKATHQLANKLTYEIEGDVRAWSLSEWVAGARHYIGVAWDQEIFNVDGNPLLVGTVIVGISLIFAGFIMAKMLSRLFGGRLHKRLGLTQDRADAFQSLSFYAMVAMFTLMALRFVNVPLTMFAFLGGALAIGVGFGSQNILNNFISGLILLVERPIRAGDLIRLQDLHGTVEHIGIRSTRVRTAKNMDIIIPNSSFLENNVENLTLGDNKIRASVAVGLAYGSPTRDAARVLKRAAHEHGLVLSSPEPFVWFIDFGDNSLNFELHFWVEVRTLTERLQIESDMRFKIDHLFRDAGITIAFPQRDVHIDTVKPLIVQMAPAEPDESSRAADDPKRAA